MTSRVHWYQHRILAITTVIPQKAHALAGQMAAGLGAKAIGGKGTGSLARDVARAKPVAPMVSHVGSNKPYARIEHFGGVITAKGGGRMLIRGTRTGAGGGSTRSTVGGSITASATSVQHAGKRYLDAVTRSFPGLFIAALRRLMP